MAIHQVTVVDFGVSEKMDTIILEQRDDSGF